MKRILSVFLTLVMCLSLVVSFNVTASAATSGGENTKTITVETKANWLYPGQESITLKQNKAKYVYEVDSFGKRKTKTASIYPSYIITIKNNTTGERTEEKWKDGSIKIKLDRNCSYTIKVSYDEAITWTRMKKTFMYYTKAPYWYVSSTHKAECW